MSTFNHFHIPLQDLTVNLHNVAPLLGYKDELPEDIFAMVNEIFHETYSCFDIQGGYQIFETIFFDKSEYQIRIENVVFNNNKLVFNQMKHSEQIAVFVCTAGEQISQWSKQMIPVDPLKGFIADILGSVVVETAIDRIQKTLSEDMEQAGLKITNRYSPGYCGWFVAEQQKLFSILPKDICGIHLTDSSLMIPIKSVSGFIGIGAKVHFNPYTCQLCEAIHCVYRHRKRT